MIISDEQRFSIVNSRCHPAILDNIG